MIPIAEVDGIDLGTVTGTITLDAEQAPHVQAEITIATPDDATLELLDPRMTPRVAITCGSRVFDLGVRRRVPSQGGAETRLSLASDEALLGDYAPLADIDLVSYAADLQSLVEHVIFLATGDTVSVGGSTADVTPYWRVVNYLRNPAVVTNLNNWTPGSGVTTTWVSAGTSGEVGVTMTAAAGQVFALDTTKMNLSCRPGEQYTFMLAQRHTSATGGSARLVLRFLDANNAAILDVQGPLVSTTTSNVYISVTGVAPPSAVKVVPYWTVNAGTGRTFRLDGGMLHTSRYPVVPFTGGDADTGGYSYEFEGASNDSASVRTPDVERDRESVVWKAGTSALEFLAPLAQASGLRLVCDETGAWTLRDENYIADGSIAIRYGVNLIDGTDTISRDSRVWFDAAARRYRWTDADGIQQERVDAFALNIPHTLLDTRDIAAAYPGPGRAEYAVRRAQNRGREVEASARADWAAAAEQPTTIILDGAPTQIGTAQRITFDLDRNQMTVNTMTADIDEDAWMLQNPAQAWSINSPDITWLAAAL